MPIDIGNHAAPRLVDWNDDGALDLLVGGGDGRIWLFLQGNATNSTDFLPRVRVTAAGSSIRAGTKNTGACLVDINGDVLPDLVVSGNDDRVRLYANIGTSDSPAFEAYKSIQSPDGIFWLPESTGGRIDIADWDRDGLLDLFAGDYSGEITWYRNIGTTNAPVLETEGVRITRNGTTLHKPYNTHPRVFDLNADGMQDIVYGINWGYVTFLINTDGHGTTDFKFSHRLHDTKGGQVQLRKLNSDDSTPDFADLNGDGVLDLISGGKNGKLFFLAGTADPSTLNSLDAVTTFAKASSLALLGNLEEARPLFEKYLSTFDQGNLTWDLVNAHRWMAHIDSREGHVKKAMERERQIMVLVDQTFYRGMHSPAYYFNAKIVSLYGLFVNEWRLGRIDQCRHLFKEAEPLRNEWITLSDPVKHPEVWANMLTRLKSGKWQTDYMELRLHWAAGRHVEYAEGLRRVLREMEDVQRKHPLSEGNRLLLKNFSSLLANEYQETGRLDEAIELKDQASRVHFGRHVALNSGQALMRLGATELRIQKHGPSRNLWRRMRADLAVMEESSDLVGRALAHRKFAQALHLAGNDKQALHHVDQALQIARDSSMNQWVPMTLRIRARVQLERGALEAARKNILEAEAIMRELGHSREKPYLLQLKGRLLRRAGRDADALKIWESAIEHCQALNRVCLHLDVLCDIMDLHLERGAQPESELTWQQIEHLLVGRPKIQSTWHSRLPDLRERYLRLAGEEGAGEAGLVGVFQKPRRDRALYTR